MHMSEISIEIKKSSERGAYSNHSEMRLRWRNYAARRAEVYRGAAIMTRPTVAKQARMRR
jgi:hypothetical protein